MDTGNSPSSHDRAVANIVHQTGAGMVAGYLASLIVRDYLSAVVTNEANALLTKVGLNASFLTTFLQEGDSPNLARWLNNAGYDERITVAQRLYLLGEWLRHQGGIYQPKLFALPVVAYSFQTGGSSPIQLSFSEKECLSHLIYPEDRRGEKPEDPIWELIRKLEDM